VLLFMAVGHRNELLPRNLMTLIHHNPFAHIFLVQATKHAHAHVFANNMWPEGECTKSARIQAHDVMLYLFIFQQPATYVQNSRKSK
jgi:hypothetical protein